MCALLADKRGMAPQALADENSAFFRTAMQTFGMSFDDFIRTTDDRHQEQVWLAAAASLLEPCRGGFKYYYRSLHAHLEPVPGFKKVAV